MSTHPALPFLGDGAPPAGSPTATSASPAMPSAAIPTAAMPTTAAVEPTPPASDPPAPITVAAAPPRPASGRNHWLDAVRGIAVIRVVLWHAFASAFLSWTIATMPAMFFVAGSLLAYSLDKRPFEQLLRKRMKRLLIPYWALGGSVLVVLALVHRSQGTAATDMSFGQFLAWLVPIVDPTGSAWEAGWVASPLWYLRCYLWLLILSPLFRKAHRAYGNRILAVPIVGLFAIDWLIRNPDLAPQMFTDYKWYIGDVVTYSFFLILGFAHHDGLAGRLNRRDRFEWAGLALGAGLLWIAFVPVQGNVVNNSYPMLFFIGIAWLAFFLGFEPEIARLQTLKYTAPVMKWIGQRAMTVYLWHTTAIVFAYWALAKFAPEAGRLTLLPIILVGTVALSVMFGWVEDVAAGKPAQWWPGRDMPHGWNRLPEGRRGGISAAVGGLAVGIIAVSFLLGAAASSTTADAASGSDGLNLPPAPSAKPPEVEFTEAPDDGGGLNLPPAPSAKPPEVEFTEAPDDDDDGGGLNLPPAPSAKPPEVEFTETDAGAGDEAPESLALTDDAGNAAIRERVQTAIDAWRLEQEIDGLYLGVSLPDGEQLLFTSGVARDGGPMTVDDDFAITSVTKTMTSALIMSLVDDGVIDLDDPIPDLDVYPGYPFAGDVTFRQLLMHTSGITTYKETDEYTASEWYNTEIDIFDALDLSAGQDLAWEPGTEVGYSSTGYITLGLLGGQLAGTDYEAALQQRIFDVADMPNSYLDQTLFNGWVGFSSGGVRSTLSDMLNWGSALYRERTVISDQSVEEVIDLDNPWSAGLGSYPVCPCWLDDDGNKVVASIGHNGGEATVQWSWQDDLIIAAGVTESWTDETTQSHIVQLLLEVRNAVAGTS